MWWWIGGIVIALVLFACWIAWKLIHTPIVDDLLAGFTLNDIDEEDESEDVGSNR